MKRVNIPQPHQLEVVDVPTPHPQANEVLLAIKAIGICGSDLHTLEGQHPFVSYPVYPGHEVSGEIIKVGEELDQSLIGQKAVIEPSLADGARPKFEPGRYNISSNLRVMGFQTVGAMSEFFAVPYERGDFGADIVGLFGSWRAAWNAKFGRTVVPRQEQY